MTDIKLSPTRAAVLRGVAAGQVKRHKGSKPSADKDRWHVPRELPKKVDAAVQWLHNANLIIQGHPEHASFFAPRPWKPTEAGEKWLAENEENA